MNKSSLLTGLAQKKYWLWLLLILLLTFLVYLPVFQNGFLKTWDDNRYVLENPNIQKISPKAIGKMFTIYYDGHYHPVTLLSLALDYQKSGLNPEPYHIHSLVLHLINTLLVFGFLYLLFRKQNTVIPLIAAFLFGISTMNIESVTWISERKNLLYSMFFLASLMAYLKYIETDRKWIYLVSLFLFLLSIISKSTAISLAVTLVLIDFYFKRQVFGRQVIFEKIPFFLLSMLFGAIAISAQKSTWGEDLSQVHYSFFERILFSGYSFILYAAKIVFPFRMSGFYPYPAELTPTVLLLCFFLVILSLLVVSGAVYTFRKRSGPSFGILFFSINIFLLLKIFEVPAGDYIMADRYAYIPSIGIFLLMATGIHSLFLGKVWIRYAGRTLLIFYSLYIMLQTFNRVPVWEDDISFYSDIILKYPKVETAYTNRGAVRKENHDLKGALSDFNKALDIGTKDYRAYSNRGSVYLDLGEYSNALADYQQAITLKPDHPQILADYGFVQMQTGDLKGAFESYSKSLGIKSFNPEVYSNRGTVRHRAGDFAGAISDYEMASKQNPEYVNAHFNRGLARLQVNDFKGAINDFLTAIKLNPRHEQAYSNMGVAWSKLNDLTKALECYDKAISLQPGYSEAWLNRGIDRYYAGDFQGSISDLNKTIELDNDMAPAFYFRAMAKIKAGEVTYCSDLEVALKFGFQSASQALALYCK
ncbi:MAG: tetratricopeptide repeat protein [Bacteroidetes bacterium]|nr:tetratricopeptide repeat protein [Bacteroidota bacterium]